MLFFTRSKAFKKVWLCNTNNSQAKPVNMWYHMQMYTPTDDNVNVQPQDRSINLSIKVLSWLNLGLYNKAMYNKSNKAAVTYLYI